jgi:hypothetical protein
MFSIARLGRFALPALLAACASTPDSEPTQAPQTYPRTRIVFRQHYEGGVQMILENYAGRDLVDLRSQPVPKGGVPVAWIPDDVMKNTVRGLGKLDFDEYARPRPGDPKSLGVRAEVTVYVDGGRGSALMRRHGQPRAEVDAFQGCYRLFHDVWTEYRPKFQAAEGDGKFGVKRADYKRD